MTQKISDTLRDKIRGCLMGVMIGDSIGMPVETLTHEEILKVTNGDGVTGFMDSVQTRIEGQRDYTAGQTTDDWQLTRAVARSLIRTKGVFDIVDCAEEHIHEFDTKSQDWGGTTTGAILDIKYGKRNVLTEPPKDPGPKRGCGNGVIMKIAPIAILHALKADVGSFWQNCEALGSITHYDKRASIAAFAVAGHLVTAFADLFHINEPIVLLELITTDVQQIETRYPSTKYRISSVLAAIPYNMEWKDGMAPGLRGPKFHARYTVAFTIGTFLRYVDSDDFRGAILEAVNAGGDTDTNASIVGAMMGASVGLSGIPQEWIDFNPDFQEAIEVADKLIEACSLD